MLIDKQSLLIDTQKDDTMSGKVVELVCLLKRKDNRTLTKFLEVLEELEYDEVANVLKTHNTYVGECSKYKQHLRR